MREGETNRTICQPIKENKESRKIDRVRVEAFILQKEGDVEYNRILSGNNKK